MPAPSNKFETGEQLDIVIKRNETWRRGFKLEEKDLDPESETYGQWVTLPLTGATILGGIKKNYDDPAYLKAFDVESRDDDDGSFIMKCDLGLAGGKLMQAPWDVIVILSSGRKIRCGAGFADLSQGVSGVAP